MSISSAMRAGVSGLLANSSALAALSDNIANVNTVAYKRSQVNFGNIVTSQYLSGAYSAGGVKAINRQYVSQQGLIQAANSSTDMAIAGEGFFVVTQKGASLQPSDARFFTRSGSFAVDSDGYLVNDQGYYLQGWPINLDGTVDRSPADLTRMAPINVRDLGAAVAKTSTMEIKANLNKDHVASAVPYVAGSMTTYADDPSAAGARRPDFVIELTVIDSAGGKRRLEVGLAKDPATPNLWNAEIYAVPTTDIEGGGTIAQGVVAFNENGTIDMAGTDVFDALTINESTGAAPAWADALGIEANDITFDVDALTQYSAPSAVDYVNPNGASPGNIVGVSVDEKGIISATFDNTEVRKIAQIGIATFPNPDGLLGVSGGAYVPTLMSGDFTIKEAGVAGAGSIAPQALEASTVDLSAEFTGLITTQRAYSASSKIITTADQMLEELLNIKR